MSSEKDKIECALENSKYEWRTIRGISKETKISRDEVIRYINSNGDKIVMSSARNQRGERLYTLRSRRRNGSIINRIFAAMKNRGD